MYKRKSKGFSLFELLLVMSIIVTGWYFAKSRLLKSSDVLVEIPISSSLKKYELILKEWGHRVKRARKDARFRKDFQAREERIVTAYVPQCKDMEAWQKCVLMMFNAGSAVVNGGIVVGNQQAVVAYIDHKGKRRDMPQPYVEEEEVGGRPSKVYYNVALAFGVWYDAEPKYVYFIADQTRHTGPGPNRDYKVRVIVDGKEWTSNLQYTETVKGGQISGTMLTPKDRNPLQVLVYQQGQPFRRYGELSHPNFSKINDQIFAILVLP